MEKNINTIFISLIPKDKKNEEQLANELIKQIYQFCYNKNELISADFINNQQKNYSLFLNEIIKYIEIKENINKCFICLNIINSSYKTIINNLLLQKFNTMKDLFFICKYKNRFLYFKKNKQIEWEKIIKKIDRLNMQEFTIDKITKYYYELKN